LKYRLDSMKMDWVNKYQGMNLYVKNLDDGVTDDQFREAFNGYGTISSAHVMRDENGASKGFGFVCFSSPEEATRAMTEMNGRMLNNKPLFVALHQRKELRRAHLNSNYGSTRNAPGMQRYPMGQAPMPYMNMYVQPGQPMPRQPYPGMMGPGMMPRGPVPGYPGRGYPVPQYGNAGPGGMQGGFKRGGGMNPQGHGRRGMGPRGGPNTGGRGQVPGGMQPRVPQQMKYNNQVRNQPQGSMMPPQQMAGGQSAQQPMPMASPSGPLDHSTLALADPQTQKNMIGERLYPLILQHQPELAGKITGMLLEMDNAELLHLLESPEALLSKIDEALQVLEAHSKGM